MKTRSRTGKIAALPEAVREELNRRLSDGEQTPQLLPWLNGLPEVRSILAERFEGVQISAQNLCAWRRGGYEDWLFARRHAEDTHKLAELAIAEAKAGGLKVLESVAAVAAMQTMHLFSEFAALNRAKARALNAVEDGCLQAGGGEEARMDLPARRARSDAPYQPLAVELLPAEAGVPGSADVGEGAGLPERRAPSSAGLRQGRRSATPCQRQVDGVLPAKAGVPVVMAVMEDAGGEEGYSLADRFNLLDKGTMSIARLGKLNHVESSLQLQRDHEAQALRIHSENLEFKMRVHEDKMELSAPINDDFPGQPRPDGLTPEGVKRIEVAAKLL